MQQCEREDRKLKKNAEEACDGRLKWRKDGGMQVSGRDDDEWYVV